MEKMGWNQKIWLGLQHVLAMFGATVLVPRLTGLDPGIAILTAGIGTLVFHSVTKGIVPVFLGSSFAFISAMGLILASYGIGALKTGIIATGLVYIVMGGVVKVVGVDKVKAFFPPVVVGPIIMVIGLRLSPVAINMLRFEGSAANNLELARVLIALVVVGTVIVVSIFAKGFFKLIPILIAVVLGYVFSMLFGMVDLSSVASAKLIGFSADTTATLFTLPEFSSNALSAVVAIAPIAFVVFIEHIGDITTNGAVVGKNFFENPGIHRTLLGDGLATIAAGFLGGPANTTYGENTGVLAVTKVYDPTIIRIAATFAIVLSLCGKFTELVRTIPDAVMGGISIVLFGMIAAVGVRTLVEEQLDFSHSRNLLIAGIIFVTGIGIVDVPVHETLTISGLAIAALLGVVLNKVLPENI
jgi:uracil permease